ncbi:hypothetical protein NP233_g3794 [Leucocoprinus birnbaumii]|uniref:Uncharacterized protein n=1 Tax=Leucocoprinus birnbaumii TaxID=56174 RepID=A0AAD5VYJ7_9AGAR|nr:hypothetical protein NP233_g3794 [Leucocoprinus birnbaumii]
MHFRLFLVATIAAFSAVALGAPQGPEASLPPDDILNPKPDPKCLDECKQKNVPICKQNCVDKKLISGPSIKTADDLANVCEEFCEAGCPDVCKWGFA